MTRRITVALAALVGVLLMAPAAFGGVPVTKTLSFPLGGNSTTSIFNKTFACCHIVVGDPLGIDTNINGGIALDTKTTINAGAHNDLTFTDTNLRQGGQLDLTNTFNRDSQSLGVDYTLSGHLSVFGIPFDYNHTEGDTIPGCGLPLLTDSCSDSKNITLFSFNVIDIGVAYLQANFLADITTTANINGNGVSSNRTMRVAGTDALPPTNLNFTATPQVKDEGVNLSCALTAGQPVSYAMGNPGSNVNGTLTEGFGIGVSGDAFIRDIPPFPDIHLFTVGPFDFPNLFGALAPVTFNTVNLTAPGQNVDLGNLLPNATAPKVAMDTIPTNGTEGNPLQLGVVGTGPGGSLSPCGAGSLVFAWTFDDGGTASGQTVNHVFAENFTGGVPHTGQVVVIDPTGLKTTLDFSVPVADAPLVASCATPPVTLRAFNGTVANLLDGNPNAPLSDFAATIDWGDSFSSPGTVSGSGGAYSVSGSHTYGSTGFFSVSVTVNDVGGSSATTTPSCQVLVFAFAPGGGAFTIGNKNSANNTPVTFWGAQWWKLNSLGGGTAPPAFKGFAKNPATPTCGTGWSTDPGNSAPPPAAPLPAYMGVIASSSIGKSGSQISGNTKSIVVVKTNPGYQGNPGHAGTGTVVATVCATDE